MGHRCRVLPFYTNCHQACPRSAGASLSLSAQEVIDTAGGSCRGPARHACAALLVSSRQRTWRSRRPHSVRHHRRHVCDGRHLPGRENLYHRVLLRAEVSALVGVSGALARRRTGLRAAYDDTSKPRPAPPARTGIDFAQLRELDWIRAVLVGLAASVVHHRANPGVIRDANPSDDSGVDVAGRLRSGLGLICALQLWHGQRGLTDWWLERLLLIVRYCAFTLATQGNRRRRPCALSAAAGLATSIDTSNAP